MNFLHDRQQLSAGESVIVECSHQCNIKLMDDANFSKYKNGHNHQYYEGFFERFPAQIDAPSLGYWNVTIDLGGGSANIRHSIRYIKR